MNPLPRLARRSQRPTDHPSVRPGGADGGPGAVSTLELLREPDRVPDRVPDRAPDRALVVPEPAAPTGPEADPFAGDRFTVDAAEWDDAPDSALPGPVPPPGEPAGADRSSSWRMLLRSLLVVLLSFVAFHHSVASLLHTIASGSVLVYVLAVPLFAGLASVAGNRRPAFVVDLDVRVRDVVLGGLTCLAALGVTTLLGPGLSGVYGLWRLDLLMLWLFLLGANLLTFGLRQVARSWAFWVVLLLLWPFPVRLANAAVGGASGGAVLLTLVVLGVVAYGHRPHDPPRWQVLGSSAAAGLVTLALLGVATHPQRLLWPAVATAVVAASWWARQARPALGTPVVGHRVRGAVPVLVGLALAGLVAMPAAPRSAPPSAPTGITSLSLGPLVVPGFVTTATTTSKEQQRYFARGSTWQRVSLRQGDPGTGPAPQGRAIVVDVISTPRPQALELYPVVTTYPMGTLSSTPDAEVELGHGVAGQVFRAEDTRHRIAYTLLTFSWRLPVDMAIAGGYTGPPAQLTQRITLIAVDDHRSAAAFPAPGNATLDGIVAAVQSVGQRQQVRQGSSLRADEQLLDDAARALVHQRLTGG